MLLSCLRSVQRRLKVLTRLLLRSNDRILLDHRHVTLGQRRTLVRDGVQRRAQVAFEMFDLDALLLQFGFRLQRPPLESGVVVGE